jgi:hypothetical protein
MDPEVVEVVAEVPASDTGVTATPASEVVTPVESPVEAVKTFTQEELDAAIGKRLAREQRKWERERQVATPAPAPVDDLKIEQFETPEAYAEAKALKIVQDRELYRQQTEIASAYHEREEDARGKYDDFDQVAYNPQLRITDVMAQTIQSSEIGPELAYHLGTNPKEADRISKLAPLVQAREIGKLEAKLVSAPPVVKKTSSAPAPFVPVTARGPATPTYDTTDPRSIKSMSTSEWIAAERVRQIKKLEAMSR